MKETHVCPVELSGSLDSRFRRWFQDPQKILSPYLKEGMKVLDVGCGPGFFSVEMAKLVGNSGKVYSVDLQQGMLDIVRKKIHGTDLETRITTIRCYDEHITIPEKVDFILAFYMVHEVPGKNGLFASIKSLLKPQGRFLLVEPKFHVQRKDFNETIRIAVESGFRINEGPRVTLSRSAILTI